MLVELDDAPGRGIAERVGVDAGDDAADASEVALDRELILFASRRNGLAFPLACPPFPFPFPFEADAEEDEGEAASRSMSSTPFISLSILPMRSSRFRHRCFISPNRRRTSPFLVERSAIPFPRILSTRSHAGE